MTTLVLLHGFTGSPGSFAPLLDAWPAHPEVFAPLLGGHGESPDLSSASFEEEVERLARLIAETPAPRRLVGYSLGGRFSLALLARHGELFTCVSVIGAHPGLRSDSERAERRASDREWLERLVREGLESFTAAWGAQPLFAAPEGAEAGRDARLEAQSRIRASHSVEGLRHALATYGLGDMPAVWDALPQMSGKLTVVVGEADEKFRGLAERIAQVAPRARVIFVPGSRHNPLIDAPSALAAALAPDLATLPAPPSLAARAPTLPRRGSARAWLLAARPATLTAALSPVLVGSAVAVTAGGGLGALRIGPGIAALLGASLLQIASNFANDVFDYESGADTEHRLGPTRAVQAGLLSPRAMRRGLLVVILLALSIGVYLTMAVGPVIVAIGIASILAALAYTGGPYPLGYHGLGDVFVMLFFGFVAVSGTTYVHLGAVPPLALLASLSVGALTTNILVVNNVRDRDTDVLAGKRTLAVRFGRRAGEREYAGLYLGALFSPVAAVALGLAPWTALLALLTAPLAWSNVKSIRNADGRALNPLLGKSARLVLIYSALFSLGLALGQLLEAGP